MDPWATFSNLAFLIVAVYWMAKVRFDARRHPLITVGVPILLVGFVGGTVFHATRSHYLWLMLDVIPILTLSILAAVYFWRRSLSGLPGLAQSYVYGIIAPLGLIVAVRIMQLPWQIRIPTGYSIMALTILVPAVYHCGQRSWRHGVWLLRALGAFLAAIIFRSMDDRAGQLVPMGSHFLWHLYGGLSAFCVLKYVYLSDLENHSEPAGATPTGSQEVR